MDWAAIEEVMLWVFFAILGLWQTHKELKNKGPKIRSAAFFISALIIIGLGIDMTSRNARERRESGKEIFDLTKGVEMLQAAKKADSLNRISDSTENANFRKELKDEFGIIKDSISGKPVLQKTYNTNVENARDIYFN